MDTTQIEVSGRILVVDDEDGLASAIEDLLSESFDWVETAHNGQEAIDKHKKDPFNVILSDLRMPILGGLDLLKQLREFDLETPFIILTAYGDQDATITALKLGAFDFLNKPFAPHVLVNRVQDALSYSLAIKQAKKDIQNFTETVQMEQYISPRVKLAAQKLLAMQNIRVVFSNSNVKKINK
ncbi:response regulator [Fluviispira multicolorata]|uniref:Response regulator n=1 Tax=Fluviispira multicolorata TaxID=2654512 RepID=A0A833N3D0_9BACT|nr:response regulator [Fluviispira multicolorata]KAB8033743.1 response regulator [Fluviispira multicolorata]